MKRLLALLLIICTVGALAAYSQPIAISARRFLDLFDTPSSYTGEAGKHAVVNVAETALEFTSMAGSHYHDGDTLQLDAVNSNGGAFTFTTSGAVTFNQLLTTPGIDIVHTATEADDHALEIDADAAGYGDLKAIDIDYITGAISAGEDEGVILINIDEIAATGGDVFGLEVLATDGSADIYGMKVGALVGPIHQDSGVFINPTTGTDNTPSTDVAAMIDGTSGTTTAIFESQNEYIIIGGAATFEEIEFILTTGASGAGIKSKWEYSTAGSHQFTEFTPVDGTNNFRNTGVVAWDAGDLTSHAVNTDTGTFDIKVTRQRVALSRSPILGYAKTAATTEYLWDKSGNVNIKTLAISTIAAEGSDVDKFLVDSSTLVKYRTGAEVLSDISGQAYNSSIDVHSDADTTGAEAPSQNQVLKWNGSTWVPGTAGDTTEFTFAISAFSDGQATTQLIGSGTWKAIGAITFTASYDNGPPTSAVVGIAGDFDGGGGSGWTDNEFDMSDAPTSKATTEATEYPDDRGDAITFELTADGETDEEVVTFQNYVWYGDPAKADTFTEADVEGETSVLASDHTRSVSINAGAGEYLLFAFPAGYTSLPVGDDYEDDGSKGTGFIFNSITCACAEDNAALEITNTAGYVENYKVYVSILANLGNHTLTTTTSTTPINLLYWGVDSDASSSEAMIEALGNSTASNTETREFTVTAGANEYGWYSYPKRLGTSTFFVGGFEGGWQAPETTSVTNSNGWTEDYYAYRTTNHSLGEITVTVTD